MSDEHAWKTCMSDEHAWKASKLEKKLEKNQACLRTCVVFFLKKKFKKNLVCSSYLSGIFFQLFFFFIMKKIFQKSPMNMVGYFFHRPKKKRTEKNTQACLWNMRGSLRLLVISCRTLEVASFENLVPEVQILPVITKPYD